MSFSMAASSCLNPLNPSAEQMSSRAAKFYLNPPSAAQIIRSNKFWQPATESGQEKKYICTIDGARFYPAEAKAREVEKLLQPVAESLGRPAPRVYPLRYDATGAQVRKGRHLVYPCHESFHIVIDEDVLRSARRRPLRPRRVRQPTEIEQRLDAQIAIKLGLF